MSAEQGSGPAADEETWMVLMDPAWHTENQDEPPPLESVVGMWPVEENGSVGRFRSNPEYRPSDESAPVDPLDAVFRLLLRGPGQVEQIRAMLGDVLLDVAFNGDGRPLVIRSPDGLPCVVAVSSMRYGTGTVAWEWRQVDLGELVDLLADGVDVLFNPGASAAIRLTGDFLRATAALTEAELAELRARTQSVDDVWGTSRPAGAG